MSAITELDEKEIASYTNLNAPGGIGPKLQFAMDSMMTIPAMRTQLSRNCRHKCLSFQEL